MVNIGTNLGSYEILGPIGSGGMGEVYRARDSKLNRDVALKFLPETFVADAERLGRFEREARVLASLNHANIASIYGVEDSTRNKALVMELVEGPTLADRIAKGPIPIDEVLPIAKQICEGLEYAHERGVVHRDLKPANIKISIDGVVKILDFGLAKALEENVASSDPSTSPTLSHLATQAGIILGTAAYMAPEQAKGRPVDRRSDIWAFGCVLYEMLTGKPMFTGETVTDVLAAVVRAEPEWPLLPPNTPDGIHRLLRRCLQKEAKQRLQAIGDARLVLEEAASGAPEDRFQVVPGPTGASSARSWVVAGALLLAFAGMAGGALLWWRSPQPLNLEVSILPPEKTRFTLMSDDASGPVALSPDGKQIAFVASDDKSNGRIYIRSLDHKEANPVPGTEGATYPFWSADGKSLGFFSGGKLRRVAVSGGPVLDICSVLRPRGGSWGEDGTILFAPDVTTGIFRVSAEHGATPVQVTTLSTAHTTNRWPVLLPDEKHFLYLASNHSQPLASGTNGIYFASLDGKVNRFVVPAESNPVFAHDHLLWVQDGTLLAQNFDPGTGRISGQAVPLVQTVGYCLSTWRAAFDASNNGVLVYQSGTATKNSELLVLGRDGQTQLALNEANRVQDIRLSPDGHSAAILVANPSLNIWILNLDKGTRRRFTFETTTDGMAWSRDGREIYYVSLSQSYRLFREAVDGSGKKDLILESPNSLHVSDVSVDGRYLLFEQPYKTLPTTTWVMPLNSGGQPRPLINDLIGSHAGRFSPDGQWILYSTPETGHFELYATSMARGGKLQLTSSGAIWSRWSSDGKKIFYESPDRSVYEMPVTETSDTLQPAPPRLLFKTPELSSTSFYTISWDVSRDGQRFMVNSTDERSDEFSATLLLNWPAILKKQ
ncbi:MAG: protein kinase [Acidobacteriia bacterium]|nr:protein kinase [Terriglobia bacterium]